MGKAPPPLRSSPIKLARACAPQRIQVHHPTVRWAFRPPSPHTSRLAASAARPSSLACSLRPRPLAAPPLLCPHRLAPSESLPASRRPTGCWSGSGPGPLPRAATGSPGRAPASPRSELPVRPRGCGGGTRGLRALAGGLAD